MSCFFCGETPAPYAVITGAETDEKGELARAKHRWTCAKCANKSLIDLLRTNGGL